MGSEISTLEAARLAFQEALRKGDSRSLFERAPCGYLTLDLDGRIIQVNQTFLTWIGRGRDEVVDRLLFTDLLATGSRVYFETHLRPLLHMHEQAHGIALDLIGHKDERLPAFVSAVLDRGRAQEMSVIRVVVFDATERRRYEQELLNAKRQAEESERRYARVARTLQETLMPPRSPSVPGLDIATAYRPAGQGDEIGGDFYDLFEVAGGDWVAAIGDVSGKGAGAAVVATLARHTVRAVAINQPSPAGILNQLNHVLRRHPSERHLTAVVARMRRIDDWWDLTIAFAGHPPAVLLNPRHSPRPIGQTGPLIGIFDQVAIRDVRLELRRGDTLLMYTDGVTEARSPHTGTFYGDDRLMRLLQSAASNPQALVGSVLEDVLRFQDHLPRDDIALLALHVPLQQHSTQRQRANTHQ